MAHDAVINVRGCKVNIRRFGHGAPLLFLHGAQGISTNEPGLDELANHFDVIAPDHPGFGLSGHSESVDDVKDLAMFYLDFLDVMKLDRVHVVGQCIGGWVALEMATTSSARFKSLVLVNSAGIRISGVPRGDMFICSEAELLKLLFVGDAAAEWLRSWRTNADVEEMYDRNRAAAAKFSWSPRLCNPKLDRWLHRIDVATHIIGAEEDRVIPPAYAQALKDRIAGATVSMIPGCAHLAHIEQPRIFADRVSQFIQKVA